MKVNFRKHYRPIQGENLWPEEVRKNISYREILPCKELQPYVACFWAVTTLSPLDDPVVDRIIPDGCMDIVFNLEDLKAGKNGSVVGIMSKPDIKEIQGIRNFIGVRFWPGGLTPFLKLSATEFTDEVVAIGDIWGKEAEMIGEKIYSESIISGKIRVLERELLNLIKDVNKGNQLVEFAVLKVLKNRGIIEIKQLARELDISQRHLTRKFKEWVGVTPKKFCSTIKFQSIIYELNSSPSKLSNIDWVNVAMNYGYYDQAHFIKEFKKYYGNTPGILIR